MAPRCRLLELPPELRNRIYELVLPINRDILVHERWHVALNLLATCRQTRSEGSSIYFGRNTFHVDYSECIQWLKHLDIQARHLVRRVATGCSGSNGRRSWECDHLRDIIDGQDLGRRMILICWEDLGDGNYGWVERRPPSECDDTSELRAFRDGIGDATSAGRRF